MYDPHYVEFVIFLWCYIHVFGPKCSYILIHNFHAQYDACVLYVQS
jgi:hypothetical protein